MSQNTGAELQDGDLMLILSKDGSVRTAGHNIDTARLRLPVEEMTDDDKALVNNGEIMFALAFAVQNAQVMAVLIEASNQVGLVDVDLLKQFARPS